MGRYAVGDVVNLRNGKGITTCKGKMAAGSADPHVALTAADIPGADLTAPFDRHILYPLLDSGCCAGEYVHQLHGIRRSLSTGSFSIK